MNKIFNKFLIGLIFLLGVILVPTFKVNAAITVKVWADGQTSKTVNYNDRVIISWEATGATSCDSGGHGTGITGDFETDRLTATTTFTVTCSAPDPLYYKLKRCTDNMIFETGPFPPGTYSVGGELLVGSVEYSTYNYTVEGSSTSHYPEASNNIATTKSGLYSCPYVPPDGGEGGATGYCAYPYGEPPYTEYCSRYTDSYNCEQGGSDCVWMW